MLPNCTNGKLMGKGTGGSGKLWTAGHLQTAYEKPERPSTPDPTRTLSHGNTTIYFGCPDVNAAYAHLCAQGIEVREPMITSYGFKALSITDPDGYNLCFHWPAN
jgi:glyoxylase I family protein